MIPGLPADVEQLGATPIMDLHHMRKAKPSAKDYVQDGLVAMWDGIENAGWGVHDSAAETWTNLVDGVQYPKGTLQWGATAAHVDANVSALFTLSPGMSSDSFSMEAVIKADNATGVAPCLTLGYQLFGGAGRGAMYCGTNQRRICVCGDLGKRLFPADTATHSIGGYFNGQTFDRVLDGQTITLSGTPYATDSRAISTLNVGGVYALPGQSDGNMGPGDIFCIRLYSRALTAAEIAHNYAIDKERFNLP